MKSDYYLNLCLEQAAMSPLRYRHGCVVVKGGKVIGQGFNDYRSGYDGGGFKTGCLPTRSFPLGDTDPKSNSKQSRRQSAILKPVGGGGGGGHQANSGLSMHSEMMAINAALTSSSAAAAAAVSHAKPYLKVPGGGGKQKRLLRRDALAAYVQRQNENPNENEQKKKNRKNCKDDRFKCKGVKRATSSRAQKDADSYADHIITNRPEGCDVPSQSRDSVKRSGGGVKGGVTAPLKNYRLLPKSRITSPSCDLQDRMKNPRLVGADVYVARLVCSPPSPPTSSSESPAQESDATVETSMSNDSSDAASRVSAPTGSLHDELTSKKKPQLRAARNEAALDRRVIAESRPCYRCVSYMHSVGIKRVFWTNSQGQWESAKVRDLVDSLDSSVPGSGGDSDASAGMGDLFVTKHEVLMLRRMFAAGAR
ncbi:hypothetical protein NKR23_g9334 [Pleurostoma richardsiae]|uniref:CMP/dCMP-type deaminase domain-containing protein n=1 Tax=Pleurostoma richardsiae TaxID=41990 RepID=A0AA38RFU8_9PEZI|nr:hypothetical protein NKR23_g9334 [Pleurostoma richardsiae]